MDEAEPEAAETEVLKALFPRNAARNRMETKMAVARTMLTKTPFNRWPLHIRVFTKDAWVVWNEFKTVNHEPEAEVAVPKAKGTRKVPAKRKPKTPPRTFDPLPELTTVMLDLGWVDGKTGERQVGTKGVTKLDGPIDVEDTEFRNAVWAKWKRSRTGGAKGTCAVCRDNIEDVDVSSRPKLTTLLQEVKREINQNLVVSQDHLNVAFCTVALPSGSLSPDPDGNNQDRECHAIAHLPCLAKHFLEHPDHSVTSNGQSARLVLPHIGTCPSCSTRSSWGEIVRGIYARREGEKEDEELAEKTRIRDMKAAEVADKKRKTEREKEEKRRLAEEAREEKRRLKETEKIGKAVTKRKGKANQVELSETD